MKIVVNTRLLLNNQLEGIGWFTFECLRRITHAHPEHDFIFLFDRPYAQQFIFSDNVTPVVLSPQARHPILYFIWFELAVTRFLRKTKPAIFISPDGYLSLRTSVKQLAVIHDINYVHLKSHLPLFEQWYYSYFFPRFAKKANRVCTVSAYSKQDLIASFGLSPEGVDVVYNGLNASFYPTDLGQQQRVKVDYTMGNDFFVYVGSLHPRKNIGNLLLAFEAFKSRNKSKARLLVVGKKMWKSGDLEEVYNQLTCKEAVVFTGRVDANELNAIIGASLALVYVSLFEGFGIPILEGFACGVPVITSTTTSMPEVAGDAALLVDPYNVNAISNALCEIHDNRGLRETLISKGTQRLTQFSWDNTAQLLWDSIIRTVNGN